jgi:hypothetical protein
MIKLTQLLKEIKIVPNKTYHDSLKALGILFHPGEPPFDESEYEWDTENMVEFCQKIGYEGDDAYDVAGEFMHYASPGDEGDMRYFRHMTGNPNLQISDLTLGMYRKYIEDEFEK